MPDGDQVFQGHVRQHLPRMDDDARLTGNTGFMIAILADAPLHCGGVRRGEEVGVQAWLGAACHDDMVGQA
jgi:hypothetical protein